MELACTTYLRASASKISSTLIILHGLLGQKTNWHSIAKAMLRLPRVRLDRIVCADLRNHGESPRSEIMTHMDLAADVKALINRLECSSAHVMGHSYGGKIAMTLALTEPELVSQLVVVDVAPGHSSKANVHLGYMKEMLAVELDPNLTRVKLRKSVDRRLKPAIPDLEIRRFLLMNLLPSQDTLPPRWKANLPAIIENFESITDQLHPEEGAVYTGPTHFIAGQNSDYITPDELPVIRKLFPKMELKTVPNAGHWVHSDNPHEFLRTVSSIFCDPSD